VGGVRRNTDETHWVYVADCPVCDEGISDEPYVLVFVGIDPEDRKDSGWTNGGAVVVHAACAGVSDEPTAEKEETS
jgi:hypothetical protein